MFNFFKKKKSSDEQNNVFVFSSDDAVIEAYKQKAQSEIQYLIDFMDANERNEELFRYAVKARFKEAEKAEHMWIQVDDFKDGYFLGRLANKPDTVKSVQYGDHVTIPRTDVEDWILEDFLTGTKVGHFSMTYLRGPGNTDKN
ncbi:MAG TPA: DUF2314 domain-containing protein [Mucilaginibacter sp.]|nr:DUF2314 domain-containing protein [Mucilaginibacter sp.]